MKVLIVYAHPKPKSFNQAILEEFTRGLDDAGHQHQTVDLYAIKFDPVYNVQDFTFWIDHTVPEEELERMNLRQQVIDGCDGFLKRQMAKIWLRNRKTSDIVDLLMQNRPKDVLEQQEKVAWADGLVFISPVYWMHFPAMLKGWVERVFTFQFAWGMKPEAYKGYVSGRVPMLKIKKALSINTTGWREEDYVSTGCQDAMQKLIDVYGLEYPGVPDVQHVYFYAVWAVDDETRQRYLQEAYSLGKSF